MKLQSLLMMTLVLSMLIFGPTIEAAKKSKVKKSNQVLKKQCAKVDQKMQRINSQLRGGYNLKKGENLKQKLRKLDKQKYACRRKRFATH